MPLSPSTCTPIYDRPIPQAVKANPPLFSLRFFRFYSFPFPFFLCIVLLHPLSLLTSKKAESAHTSP